jgi:hypothetical protein
MRIFYTVWFFFCAGWGHLLSKFPHQEGDTFALAFLAFPIAIFTMGLMAFFGLRSKSVPAEGARLSVDLKPWHQPLGILQFVCITFVFSAMWGIGLSMWSQGGNVIYAGQVLAMASGGLLGTWGACRVYRSIHAA